MSFSEPKPVHPRVMGRDGKSVRHREDIYDLQVAYDMKKVAEEEDKRAEDERKEDERKKLAMEKILWAFHKIQQLPPQDPNSFFQIAGYHGMPFRGAGWGNPSWWGGYCNHGNVLFPTWHRAYLVRLENALSSVEGCEDVALAYWNETSDESLNNGIPSIFLRPTVTISGSVAGCDKDQVISNPLRSCTLQDGIWDNLNPVSDANYSKPKGYETKRYPFSGLVSSGDIGTTAQHNWLVSLIPDTNKLLNQNVKNWLGDSITTSGGQILRTNALYKYQQCLEAPSYTVFSNTTSATQYNEDVYYNTPGNAVEAQSVPGKFPRLPAVSLESPHNDIHLAIGGFGIPGQGDLSPIIGANGDMGENDTAAFDPIFFFHHCFIDKVFWDWQCKWDSRRNLTIDLGYPGTNSVDYQGPTPGVPGNTWLTMESPLGPFTRNDMPEGVPAPLHFGKKWVESECTDKEDKKEGDQASKGNQCGCRYVCGHSKSETALLTSNDVVNIVTQLGYMYYQTDMWDNPVEFDHRDDTDNQDSCNNRRGNKMSPIQDAVAKIFNLPSRSGTDANKGDTGRVKVETSPVKGGTSPDKGKAVPDKGEAKTAAKVVRISGVNRAALPGSFVLVVRAEVDGEDRVVGTESVLSRWKVSGCANCQNHLGVKAFVPLVGLPKEAIPSVRVGLYGRGETVEDLNNETSIPGGWRLGNLEMRGHV